MKYNCAMYVSQIRQITIRVLNQILKKNGVTLFNAEQSKILEILWQEDNISPKNISKHTGLAVSSLTSMLDRMETNGLIKKSSAKNDRRKILVSLTDLGKNLKKDFEQAVEEIKIYTFKDFKNEEVKLFESYLERVFKNLESLL